MPGAALACLLAMPARYLTTALLLASLYFPASLASTSLGAYVRWQLGEGLIVLQSAAMATAAMAGAVAWTRGSLGESLRGYGRLLASQGGRVVATFAMAGLLGGTLAGVAYALVLALPTSTWVLASADAYAHYLTLPVGLWTLSALVELAERALPTATLAPEATAAPTTLAP
jgi:hypothetical protein